MLSTVYTTNGQREKEYLWEKVLIKLFAPNKSNISICPFSFFLLCFICSVHSLWIDTSGSFKWNILNNDAENDFQHQELSAESKGSLCANVCSRSCSPAYHSYFFCLIHTHAIFFLVFFTFVWFHFPLFFGLHPQFHSSSFVERFSFILFLSFLFTIRSEVHDYCRFTRARFITSRCAHIILFTFIFECLH